MELFATLQTLASGRMGAAMKAMQHLFTANVFEQIHQRGVGWNGLPFTHDALRVNDFAGEHGATVHRELQNVHHLFAAVHFHVRARRNIKSTALRFLGCSVIEQAPKRSNGARTFDGAIVHIDDARVGGGDFLPFGMCNMGRKKATQYGHNCSDCFQIAVELASKFKMIQSFVYSNHGPYYKVVERY